MTYYVSELSFQNFRFGDFVLELFVSACVVRVCVFLVIAVELDLNH